MKNGTTTGLRPDTFKHLQLNAGLFLEGFDWSAIKTVEALKAALVTFIKADKGVLGATRGGGSFNATADIRYVEADGKRYEYVGSAINDGWKVKLSTTLIEATPENFALGLMCADIERPEDSPNMAIVTVRTAIDDSDYRPKLCWIGDTSRGFMLIELDNALNTEGANFTFKDKGEGTLPVTFSAHQSDLEHQDHAPFRIVFFDEPAAGPLMLADIEADGALATAKATTTKAKATTTKA